MNLVKEMNKNTQIKHYSMNKNIKISLKKILKKASRLIHKRGSFS